MLSLLHQLSTELPPAPPTPSNPSSRARAAASKLGAGKKGHPQEVFEYHGTLLVHYARAARSLEEVYDGMVHPQKRRAVRVVLDAVLGRVTELWKWLVAHEGRNPPSLDAILLDLKESWHVLSLPVPRYFRDAHGALLTQRDELLDALLAQKAVADAQAAAEDAQAAVQAAAHDQAGNAPSVESGLGILSGGAAGVLAASDAAAARKIKVAAAADLLRRAERARVRRVEAVRAAEAYAAEAIRGEMGRGESLVGGDGFVDVEAASNLITRVARGHLVRKEVQLLRDEELQLLGMQREDRRETDAAQAAADVAFRAKKKTIQIEHEAEYQDALVSIKQRIYEDQGPILKEEMEDQIRRWFLSHLRQTGKWPEYPSEAAGGSAKIFLEPPAETSIAGAEDEGNARSGRRPGGGGGGGGGGGRTTFGRGRGADSDEDKIDIPPSAYLVDIQDRVNTFLSLWQDADEGDNFQQRADEGIIREEALPVVERELRLQVDEIMRVELEGIKIKFTGKKKRKKKRKKKDGNKPRQAGVGARPSNRADKDRVPGAGPKPGKPKRSRRPKDPTAGLSTEELYGELVMAGIVVKTEEGDLEDFVGDVSHLASTLKAAGIEPDPSYADIRRSLSLEAIIPLGSPALSAKGGGTKGVLLAGPPGCGKSMLASRIAWLTGANVFDLSPANMMGKFPGKTVALALHKVFKVAKAMAPSIILIEDADLMFTKPKKLPPAYKGPGGPRRYRKALLKQAKSIKPGSRVMMVGTSSNPWNATLKLLLRLFPSVTHIPRPDYATRALLWRTFIEAKGLFLPDSFDLSTLAKISDGYLAGAIESVVSSVLTPARARMLESTPLSVSEFVKPLAATDPLFAEDDARWKKWVAKLPLSKALNQRKAEAAAAEAERAKNARYRR